MSRPPPVATPPGPSMGGAPQRPRSFLHRLRRHWHSLQPPERQALPTVCIALPLAWLGLRVFGLQRMHALIARRPLEAVPGPRPAQQVPAATAGAPLARAQRLGALVNLAARHGPWPATCLSRSLALQWLLRRRGIDGVLRIGVRKDGGLLDAHAWVEVDGLPVNDLADVARDYAVFDPLPPAPARGRAP